MAYRFRRKDKSVEMAVRRIAREQVDIALAEIAAEQTDPHRTVHQMRKHAKKLRGLIRLVRSQFPRYAEENRAIRDAARQLSSLRDRAGMAEALDRLIVAASDPDVTARLAPVREWLDGDLDTGTGDDIVPGQLDAFATALAALRLRTDAWKIRSGGFSALQGGLKRSFASGRKAMAVFAADPADGNAHEWRKHVKYHWYHARLLSKAKPRKIKRHARQVRELGEVLGDFHDLGGLAARLSRYDSAPFTAAQRAEALSLIDKRRRDLANRALRLGRRLYADRPGKMVKRWKRHWKRWKPRAA